VILSANLTWLFTEAPLIERPRLAAEAGFGAVEILAPYEIEADAMRAAIENAGLTLDLINSPREELTGCAAIPGEEERFARSFDTAASYARASGCGKLHVLSGKTDAPDARATLVRNLSRAVAEAPDLLLTLEPLCPQSMPGYYLNDVHLAADIVREIGAPNLGLQYDSFHAAMIHGDARAVWDAVADISTHVQISSPPGRTRPDASVLDLLEHIVATGYSRVVAAEYDPEGPTPESLGWMKRAADIMGVEFLPDPASSS
jgi:2-dehydrotetronate isomerase